MNPNKLQERLVFVKGSELKNRASLKVFSRREISDVKPDEDTETAHETFFDFEEELSEMKSSAEQYSKMINAEPYITLEEREEDSSDNDTETSPVIMEDNNEQEAVRGILMETAEGKAHSKFKFIRCEQIKADGIRCKRQAKKNEVLCAAHRKMMNKCRSLK